MLQAVGVLENTSTGHNHVYDFTDVILQQNLPNLLQLETIINETKTSVRKSNTYPDLNSAMSALLLKQIYTFSVIQDI